MRRQRKRSPNKLGVDSGSFDRVFDVVREAIEASGAGTPAAIEH